MSQCQGYSFILPFILLSLGLILIFSSFFLNSSCVECQHTLARITPLSLSFVHLPNFHLRILNKDNTIAFMSLKALSMIGMCTLVKQFYTGFSNSRSKCEFTQYELQCVNTHTILAQILAFNHKCTLCSSRHRMQLNVTNTI